ncbi:hypothetical protein ACKKBG_A36335 [Auxenochlorella protothecoides x Auxenochlorella symbiontica]
MDTADTETSDRGQEEKAETFTTSQGPAAAVKTSPTSNIVLGALEEVQLIQWPTIPQALVNTVQVLIIVGTTSVLLFAVNSILTELSRRAYG